MNTAHTQHTKRPADIAVIGGGPAGLTAAIQAAACRKRVILFERNPAPGRKILLTGKGRCNITNASDPDVFVEKFGPQGRFLKHAFYSYTSRDVIRFFEANGLPLKTERQSRVFPQNDKAASVAATLRDAAQKAGVIIRTHTRLQRIIPQTDGFDLIFHEGPAQSARRVILCCGGASYQATGSTGDGFRIAKGLGHEVLPLCPALVPLKVKENWVKDLQGLTLKNVRVTFVPQKKKILSPVGDLMFTHFGVSGPLILDLSGTVVSFFSRTKTVPLFIDCKPGLTPTQIEERLRRDIKNHGQRLFKSVLLDMLPKRMADPLLKAAAIPPDKKSSQITATQRRQTAELLKGLPMTINGALSLEHAMVTNGGVSTRNINPKTMESRIIPGLFFAGEVIDGAAPSGGYNLQQAFSTGYLAGLSAGSSI